MEAARPLVREMIKEAVTALGGRCTRAQIMDYINQHYPGTNEHTVSTQIGICVVNQKSRVHYPENQRARICNDERYDFMYAVERGVYELYNPKKHGVWQIVKQDGRLSIAKLDRPSPAAAKSDQPRMPALGDKKYLASLAARSLSELEPGLRLYGEPEASGIDFKTDIGTIDLLCSDKEGRPVVVEVAAGGEPDAACGRLLQRMGWARTNLPNGDGVRGILLIEKADTALYYASAIPGVQAFIVRPSLTFTPVRPT